MELSFVCENSAEASFLVQELEQLLRQKGMPREAMKLKPASPENMDIGSVFAFIAENATPVLTTAKSVVTLATAVYQVATKYSADVIVADQDGKVRIPAAKMDMDRIQAAVARKPKPKQRTKG